MTVEKLSENIFYVINTAAVHDLSTPTPKLLTDLGQAREALQPIQSLTGHRILSTAATATPENMRLAFKKNPWEVLDDIRPIHFVEPHPNPEMIPVLFESRGEEYAGWQMKRVLPMLLRVRRFSIFDVRVRILIRRALLVLGGLLENASIAYLRRINFFVAVKFPLSIR